MQERLARSERGLALLDPALVLQRGYAWLADEAGATVVINARNRDMRLVLDTVSQGLMTVDRQLAMSNEKSTILERWFGPAQPGQLLTAYLGSQHAAFAENLNLGWQQVIEDGQDAKAVAEGKKALEKLRCPYVIKDKRGGHVANLCL